MRIKEIEEYIENPRKNLMKTRYKNNMHGDIELESNIITNFDRSSMILH